MSASAVQACTDPSHDRETANQREERIYNSLPALGSREYTHLLKTASAAELPASVLVRAYRRSYPSAAASATLERLVGQNERYGYITMLKGAARRKAARLNGYTPDDLVHDTIVEIVTTLAGPRGESAERHWPGYVYDCMTEAYRALVGRRGERLVEHAEESLEELEADAPIGSIPWHGCVAPSNLEWLEAFLGLTAAAIPKRPIRVVALDLCSHAPMPVSNDDPTDVNTLAGLLAVTRFKIYRWQRRARAILFAALDRQNECEIDMSFLALAT